MEDWGYLCYWNKSGWRASTALCAPTFDALPNELEKVADSLNSTGEVRSKEIDQKAKFNDNEDQTPDEHVFYDRKVGAQCKWDQETNSKVVSRSWRKKEFFTKELGKPLLFAESDQHNNHREIEESSSFARHEEEHRQKAEGQEEKETSNNEKDGKAFVAFSISFQVFRFLT